MTQTLFRTSIKYSTIKLIFTSLVFFLFLTFPPGARAALPDVKQLYVSGKLDGKGNLAMEQTITFSQPVSAEEFRWIIPSPVTGGVILKIGPTAVRPRLSSHQHYGYLVQASSAHEHNAIYTINYTIYNPIRTNKTTYFLHSQLISKAPATILQADVSIQLPHIPHDKIQARLFYTNTTTPPTYLITNQNILSATIPHVRSESSIGASVQWPKNSGPLFPSRSADPLTSTSIPTSWLSFILALLSLGLAIFLFFLTRKWWRIERFRRTQGQHDTPPGALSPVIMSVLLNKQLKHRALLAAIFDLAYRGYIDISEEKQRYTFRKPPPLHPLSNQPSNWEREFLDQIFASTPNSPVDIKQVTQYSKHQIYSTTVADLYNRVYDEATQLGLFITNPHQIRVRFKTVGLILYISSLFGVISHILVRQPSFWLIPSASLFFLSLLIIRTAPLVPVRSQIGNNVLRDCYRFRAFLADSSPISAEELLYGYSYSDLFFRYLPYAIVLGVEKRWARRFNLEQVVQPTWFHSLDGTPTDVFTHYFIKNASKISRSFVLLHGPIVE